MLFPLAGFLAVASSLLSLAAAHNIQMKSHMRECFHEQLHKDDKMTVTFQVGDREFGGSGNLEIDFWVRQRRRNLPTFANLACSVS
jgi:p24 family protein beta-1